MNCWEFKRCGRDPGGKLSTDLGVCPAAIQMKTDGVHHGAMGGRACWVIAGTICHGEVQGTFAVKLNTCFKCDFYNLVKREEGGNFLDEVAVLEKIHSYL